MIKCDDTACTLYSKDGSKKLGTYPFSEHGGEEGARKAAEDRERQVVMFREMKKSLLDAMDEFGAPAVLEWIIEKSVDCEGCEDAILKALGAEEVDIEKAKKKRKRRITIEDEDDDDDGNGKEREREGEPTEAEGAPAARETEGEPEAEPKEEEKPVPPKEEAAPPKKEGGPFGQGRGEGRMAQEGAELPKGWTPESLKAYWEKLGGSVESCVGNAPDTVKDKQTFCQRLEGKVKATGGGEAGEKEEKAAPPKPPFGKSLDEVLGALADLLIEKAEGYKGEVGWDDPQSWLKAGTPDEIRAKAWKRMGSSVTTCMEHVKGKVDDPGRFCAALKDKVTGTTEWRGKKKGEAEKSLLSELEDVIQKSEAGDEWEELLKSLPEADILAVVEEGGEEPVEDQPTFLGLVRKSHNQGMGGLVAGLVRDMGAELEGEE